MNCVIKILAFEEMQFFSFDEKLQAKYIFLHGLQILVTTDFIS